MPLIVHELGEAEIEAARGPGSGLHGNAKTGLSRLGAIDGHDEGVASARLIGLVLEGTVDEHPVLHGDSADLAGAHADKSIARAFPGIRFELQAAIRLAYFPQGLAWWMQKPLPRMRPHDIAEDSRIITPLQPVAPGPVTIAPAGRQVFHAGNVVIDDGPVAEARSEHPITPCRQSPDQRIEPFGRDESGACCLGHLLASFRCSIPDAITPTRAGLPVHDPDNVGIGKALAALAQRRRPGLLLLRTPVAAPRRRCGGAVPPPAGRNRAAWSGTPPPRTARAFHAPAHSPFLHPASVRR